ncbi:hypothetical protein [Streptomyces sp. NBC_01497]|uniref:hypothetical protein n=1 Tax=Streptomyces sp. NBC_01497 TaxID=2903885 RepID=UPI002E2F0242|nr:hypothetical protein [Streptomyces sp. NBC_01497]
MVEAVRVLRVARRSAVKARTQAMNQIRGLLVSAPAMLREQTAGLERATRYGLWPGSGPVTTYSVRRLPRVRPCAVWPAATRRWTRRSTELDAELGLLTRRAALALLGTKPDSR